MKTCEECGRQESTGAESCPACGGALARAPQASVDAPPLEAVADGSVVPAGTFASIPSDVSELGGAQAAAVGMPARRGADRERPGPIRRVEPTARAQVVQLPVRAREGGRDATESGVRAQSSARLQPPWLATEILRERPDPEPLAVLGRILSAAAGLCGVGAALVFAGLGAEHGYLVAGIFALLAGGALVPIPFMVRAGGLAVIASVGLGLAVTLRGGEGSEIELAVLGSTLLAGAQLLRSLRHASRFANSAMAVGLGVSATWLLLSGGLSAFVVQGPGIEAWLGPAVRIALVLALVLSLFAWLDPGGASGTDIWPWVMLGWVGLESAALLLGGTAGGPVDATHGLAVVATPLLALVSAVAWAQVWATTPGIGSPARESGRAS